MDSKLEIMAKAEYNLSKEDCQSTIRPVLDALEVLSGKWKLVILVSIAHGSRRFKQISKDVGKITDKVLSKELKDLEAHKLITRNVYDSFPPTVEYEMTAHGQSLEKVIVELGNWGRLHRKRIMGK